MLTLIPVYPSVVQLVSNIFYTCQSSYSVCFCMWHCLGGISSHIMCIRNANCVCDYGSFVVQIVSHHVNLHPTFHWSYLLLALSMYVNSIDKCKDYEWLVFTLFQKVCEACIFIEPHWLWSGNLPHQRVCGYFWWWNNNLLIVSWPSLITRR